MINVQVKVVDERLFDFGIPDYQTPGAAGIDLRAIDFIETRIPNQEEKPKSYLQDDKNWQSTVVGKNMQIVIGCGLSFYIADNRYAALLLPRSSMRNKFGFRLSNTVGLLDSDYQGQMMMTIENLSGTPFTIEHGERIAQLVFIPVEQAALTVVDEFDVVTGRADGGHGHTGAK